MEGPPYESRILLPLALSLQLLAAVPLVAGFLVPDAAGMVLLGVGVILELVSTVCLVIGVYRVAAALDWLVESDLSRRRAERKRSQDGVDGRRD